VGIEAAIGTLVAAGLWSEQDGRQLVRFQTVDVDQLRDVQSQVLAFAEGLAADEEPDYRAIEQLSAAADLARAVDAELHRRLETTEARRVAADQLARTIAASAAGSDDAVDRLDGSTARRRLPSIRRLAAHQPGRTRPTAPAQRGSGRVLTAAGQPVDDVEHAAVIAAAAIERQVAQRHGWQGRELIPLVTSRVEFPAERQLGRDEWENERRLAEVTGPEALVASGGICAPVSVDYSVSSIATPDRPVRSALAQFGAARGGLRYVIPHSLASVASDGGVSVWTEATDANPGGNTKPHATFLCQSVNEAYVDAITSIISFGNFQARYAPEQVAAYMETTEAYHSRVAEAALLAAISGGSVRSTADNYEIGAARDFLATLDRAASAYRYRNRLAPDFPLRVIYPQYVNDAIRADLTKSMPGDSGGGSERLAVSDDEIAGWLRVRHINSSTTYDSVTTSSAYNGGVSLQGFGAQGNGQLQPWPLTTLCWMYHEGAWIFLDGGELTLGMVRDSTLNAKNDYQWFSETFEKAIFRGHESLEIAMKIAPLGTSVGTVAGTTETVGS
jgi:hypothetical protein